MSLLPALLAPLIGTARHTAAVTYARWVEAQLDGTDDPHIAAALETAIAAKPGSLDEFIEAFIAAMPVDETAILGDLSASNASLMAHLQRRMMGLVGDALPARLLLGKALQQAPTVDRPGAAALRIANRLSSLLPGLASPILVVLPATTGLLHVLSAAQPLGP